MELYFRYSLLLTCWFAAEVGYRNYAHSMNPWFCIGKKLLEFVRFRNNSEHISTPNLTPLGLPPANEQVVLSTLCLSWWLTPYPRSCWEWPGNCFDICDRRIVSWESTPTLLLFIVVSILCSKSFPLFSRAAINLCLNLFKNSYLYHSAIGHIKFNRFLTSMYLQDMGISIRIDINILNIIIS